MLNRAIKFLVISVLLLNISHHRWLTADDSLPLVRVGVLNFGTVNWELAVIKNRNLDSINKINIKIVPLGSKNATHVALQGDAVDIIVTDWVWVSRQRYTKKDYTFVPYSTATGSVIIKNNSPISTLAELKDTQMGVAGGPVDKSWILLSAYIRKELDQDLANMLTPNFAAPPLLNELFIRGDFDAVLNFWHYSARLQALGHKTLISINDILPELGIDKPVPMIGWVFSEQWAHENPDLISRFLETSSQAKQLMLNSDDVWNEIRPMMKVDDEQMFLSLRTAFRQGISGCFGQQHLNAMTKAYSILADYGGKELIGDADELVNGTVWEKSILGSCD